MDVDSIDYRKFVLEHSVDDTARLVLSRQKWPGIDLDMVVTAIECRRKIRTKLPQWYAEAGIIYPDRVCAEQSSSSETAAYKASVAERILSSLLADVVGVEPLKPADDERKGRVADLTGGLGVDSLAFSRVASDVLYNEMDHDRACAAEHNFRLLGAGNIHVMSNCVEPESDGFWEKLRDFKPDIVYMDPARRASDGSKVFLLEDCSPDVLTLLPHVFGVAHELLLKLSPMADISMLTGRLKEHGGYVHEVHVVATAGECKELLLRVKDSPCGTARLIVNENGHILPYADGCLEIGSDSGFVPVFMESPRLLPSMEYIFEPGKALAKAGLFNAVCTLFSPASEPVSVMKAGRSTHLYFVDGNRPAMKDFGKLFRVMDVLPLDRKNLKVLAMKYPKAEVSARNIPMSSDALRKKLKVSSGGDVHIFGMRVDFLSAPSACYLVAAVRS